MLFSITAFAQVQPVQDNYGLLTTKESKQLTDLLLKHKTKIVIILKDSDNIEQDALSYGRANGPDIVIWYNKKTVRVETGTKLEGDLPDLASSTIVRNNLQLLKDKKYYDFFKEVSLGIYQKVENPGDKPKVEGDLIKFLIDHPFILLVVFILWLILLFICPDCALFFLWFLASSRSSGGGSGDFSGGGSSTSD